MIRCLRMAAITWAIQHKHICIRPCKHILEMIEKGELDLPRRPRTGDAPEAGIVPAIVGPQPLSMVKGVVSFESEFHPVVLPNSKRFSEGRVPVVHARIVDDSLTGVSPRTKGWLHEATGIEPLKPITRRVIGVTPCDPIGVLVAISRSTVIQIHYGLWNSSRKLGDAANCPTAEHCVSNAGHAVLQPFAERQPVGPGAHEASIGS